MTTITRFTTEQLIKRLDEQMSSARYALGFVQDSEILRDIEMDLRLAEIALSSLTAEPIGAFHISDQQVEGTSDYIKDGEWPIDNGVIEVYTAPPAPVVPTFEEWLEIRGNKPLGWVKDAMRESYDACRAAMLQGSQPVSQSDELPLDYLQGHKDGLEWAAQLAEANHPQTGDWLYDDPTELARAIRKGPDMPAVEAGNSPVIPDGWISCSERMPEADGNYWGWWSESKRQGPVWFIKSDLQAQFQSSEITHWMPLPAASQQK